LAPHDDGFARSANAPLAARSRGLESANRRLFVTTSTELQAIAAPAIIGFR
jgi:hypothetical protein